MRIHHLLALCAVLGSSVFAADMPRHPMGVADLLSLHRLSDPQISPDGKWVLYTIADVVEGENRTNSDVWIIAADGSGQARALTNSPRHDRHARWSPDGKWIAFESMREGTSQIFLLPIDGGEPRKLTTLSTGASQPIWSPDGKSIAFVSAVFPEFSNRPSAESDKLNREKQDARDAGKVKARLIDKLLYRHWDEWVEDKRQHLFVVHVTPTGAADGDPRDVTPGENDAVPTSSTFSAGDEYAFSADSQELAYCAPPLPIREQAWSTNHDIWTVNLTTGERRNLTAANLAADGLPRYSPDGKYLAYRAQSRAGFEADKWDLWVLDRATGQKRKLVLDQDLSVDFFTWAPSGKQIYFEALKAEMAPIWRLDVEKGGAAPLNTGKVASEVDVAANGSFLVWTDQSMAKPPEVVRFDLGDVAPKNPPRLAPLTHANDGQLAKVEMGAYESVRVNGAGGTPVQMWILKPPGFDAAKKYPLVFWVHGGPQTAYRDAWSTRWNPQVWAAQGYVIAMPNPRGSVGFGQKFTDEISRDWGGKVFEDLMACLGYLEKQPYVDSTRMAAAGASYGGYMMNWFEGHVDKFRCLVNHDGVYNFDSMYGTTEELWFEDYEHGQPWADPDFDKFSPHKFAANFKTPMLIIHNDLDFRVPVSEGLQVFTLLQRKGVPSKLLMFPDEGHWVLKPQNSELWHKTIFEWLGEYLKR
jgi:dipeptidyl aminopeptidase/acylaminoacyl peptidase